MTAPKRALLIESILVLAATVAAEITITKAAYATSAVIGVFPD